MQLRHHLTLEEREEAVLIRSHLVHPDMVVAGFEELTDSLETLLGIGPTRDTLRDVVLADELDRLLEVSGHR